MTVTALARRYRVDVSLDGSTAWTQIKGIDDLNLGFTPTKTDSTSYDTDGWTSNEIPMQGWAHVLKVLRRATGGVWDPGLELVRACVGQFGASARIYVRWYDISGISTGTPGIVEAGSGYAIVEISRSKTGVGDLEEWQVTFTGDGAPASIAIPAFGTASPVVNSATPSGVAAAGQVLITGTGFTGTVVTTGVKFGGTNATSWIVINDTLISAVMPTGSAGSAAVVVTNANGASNSFPYTRG